MPLDPAYLSAIAAQLANLGAFLGGFAATFLATLIVADARGRSAAWAIGCAGVSAVAFIVSVVASTTLLAQLHPNAPALVHGAGGAGRVLSTLAFVVGLYALLAAVGLSGWIRSVRTGRTTATIAAAGAVLVTMLVVQVG